MLVDRAYIPCHGKGLLEKRTSSVCARVFACGIWRIRMSNRTPCGKKAEKKISLPADAACNNCPSKIDDYKADHVATIVSTIQCQNQRVSLGLSILLRPTAQRSVVHLISSVPALYSHGIRALCFGCAPQIDAIWIYYVQADTMDRVRDTCRCKSGFEMTLLSAMSAT